MKKRKVMTVKTVKTTRRSRKKSKLVRRQEMCRRKTYQLKQREKRGKTSRTQVSTCLVLMIIYWLEMNMKEKKTG
jgi:hypothetical protein